MSIRNICGMAATDNIDANTCSLATNCTSCTDTLQLGGTACKWYDDGSGQAWCGNGECDMWGNCGMSECPRVANGDGSNSLDDALEYAPCSNMTNCLDCLDNENNCGWAAGSCHDPSHLLADASYYIEANFPGMEKETICTIADTDARNQELCSATTCSDCTNTAMQTTSGDSTCSCLLYTSPSPRDQRGSRMPSSA